MNKNEFVKKLAEKQGITIKQAKENLDHTLKTIGDVLESGEQVMFKGQFSLTPVEKKSRKVVLNGKTIQTKACNTVKFKIGKDLKNYIN